MDFLEEIGKNWEFWCLFFIWKEISKKKSNFIQKWQMQKSIHDKKKCSNAPLNNAIFH